MLKFLTGFRKFTAFILYFAVTTVLMVAGLVTGDIYMREVTAGLGAFMATNIGEHLITVAKDWINQVKGSK